MRSEPLHTTKNIYLLNNFCVRVAMNIASIIKSTNALIAATRAWGSPGSLKVKLSQRRPVARTVHLRQRPVTSIWLLNSSANYVHIREDQELGENVQKSNSFDYLLSSDGKTITRSGLTTITTRSSADPCSSGVASRLVYFCEAALIKWKSGSSSIRTTAPRISRAR